MSEVKQWLMSIGIPEIERLADEFESRGFSTRKSLQYLQVGDLDYIFSSPKREHWTTNPGGGGVLPNMGYIGMCGPKG